MNSNAAMNPAPRRIVIWGGGGHGHVVADLLQAIGGWKIEGFVDNLHSQGSSIMGFPVLGDADRLGDLMRQGVDHVVVAIGACDARAGMLEQARAAGFRTPTLIHPSCVIAPSASIGDACVLCAGAIVGAQARIGDGVIVNTRASVDHDVQLGPFVHVAPGAVLCGFISIGRETWVGAGAVVRDHLTIGAQVLIGAGAVVVKDIPDGLTVMGNPASSRRS